MRPNPSQQPVKSLEPSRKNGLALCLPPPQASPAKAEGPGMSAQGVRDFA